MKMPMTTTLLAAALIIPAQAQTPATQPATGAARPAQPATGQLRPTAPRAFQPTPQPGSTGRPTAPGVNPRANQPPPATAPGAAPKADSEVRPADAKPPEPTPIGELGKPTIPLPNVPFEPYLLRRENGPFMVMVHTFRGPEATQYAMALILELREEYRLPAYLFHLKIKPGGSNIRGVQPTANEDVPIGEIEAPEQYRIYDEAAVLVGDCSTIDEARRLLHRVKKLRPKSLDGLPTIWGHRRGQGLRWAMVTQNPLIPAQALYPGEKEGRKHGGHAAAAAPSPIRPDGSFDPFVAASAFQQNKQADPLVVRMNRGPNSIYKCSGPYTLPVAEFHGRTAADPSDPKFNDSSFLRKSPLATAADDAERLANSLSKCKNLPAGIQPFVYHDRYSSKVCLGSFQGPDDPMLERLRQSIIALNTEMLEKQYTQLPLAPSPELMVVPRP